MRNWYHSWRAAVRIARRDAWRSKGRSLLVLSMIALPIMGVSGLDLTFRSDQLSASETLDRGLGAADARFSDPGMAGLALLQDPAGSSYTTVENYDDKPYPSGSADLAKAVPAGARALSDTLGNATLRTKYGLLQSEVRELRASDPMTRGIFRLDDGRFPAKPTEVAATVHFLEASGLRVGSTLKARGLDTPYRIVGAYELPNALQTDQVNALPGALLAPLARATSAGGRAVSEATTTQLVEVPGGFTWNMVQRANTHGVLVVSRAVTLDPPARIDVPLYRRPGFGAIGGSSPSSDELTVGATIVGMAMLEICLLAGAAFTVGARRSRRQLGLVGANGGDRSHIRAIVLAGGLVIGVAAAVVGISLGLGLTFLLRPVLENLLGHRFGSFDIRPLELLGIALLAVVTGLLAALVPAVTASRQSVLASLTGRRGVRRSSRVLPALGLTGLVVGAVIALYGSTVSSQFTLVTGGSILAELGVVAMTPALVGLFGRVGRWLPLAPRLALRDAVRNRSRTAPAVAAVLAAVAGTVAVSTYVTSVQVEEKAAYRPQLPYAAVSVMPSDGGGSDVPAIRTAVQQNLAVSVQADVDRLVVGRTSCPPYNEGDPDCGTYQVVVPEDQQCPLRRTGEKKTYTGAERRRILADDPRCTTSGISSGPAGSAVDGVLVGDAKLLSVLHIHDPAAARALADGKVVVLDKRDLSGGDRVGIRRITDYAKAEEAENKRVDPPGRIMSFPAHQVPGSPESYGVSMIVPRAAARSAGFATAPAGSYFSTTRMPDGTQRQKLDAALAHTGVQAALYVEKGYSSDKDIVTLALTVFAGLITIGSAGIATGLAQADAEADLRTLAAVGAPSRVRRTLSAFQCAVVAAMGVLLGSVAGVLPGIGLRLADRQSEAHDFAVPPVAPSHVTIVLPWGTLAALLIAVPLGAALLAALLTRSQKALGRRAVA